MTGDVDRRLGADEADHFDGYVACKVIGSGGMGTVYEARHPTLDKRVALKVIKGTLARDPVARERFTREARAIALVSHPNVVEVFDLGIDDERAFIVMELLEGETLAALLARKGKLGVTRAVELFLPLISAAAAIHDTGVVHRDLKPGNVMLARRGHYAVEPVVLDFGISRIGEGSSGDLELTEPHLLVGTLPYVAPEQLRDARAAGRQSDQYALGVMLYECVTGRKPFTGADRYELINAVMTEPIDAPSAIDRAIPAELDAVVLRALARRPEARFPSMRAFGSALLSVADRSAWKRWAAEFAGADPTTIDVSTETGQDVRTRPVASGTSARLAPRWGALGVGALVIGLVAVAMSVDRSPTSSPRRLSPATHAPAERLPIAAASQAPATSLPPVGSRDDNQEKRPARPGRRPRSQQESSIGAGTLAVNASPEWATVTIDGKRAGTTPFVLPNVRAGRHILQAKARGQARSLQRAVIIEAGRTARVEFDFSHR